MKILDQGRVRTRDLKGDVICQETVNLFPSLTTGCLPGASPLPINDPQLEFPDNFRLNDQNGGRVLRVPFSVRYVGSVKRNHQNHTQL